MNPEIKKKWVEALRSGKYEQGKGVLRSIDNKYCCLGVLCEIAVQEGICLAPSLKDHNESYRDDAYLYTTTNESGVNYSSSSHLPFGVLTWSGVNHPSGELVVIKESRAALSMHNDRDRTFKEIADAIEEQL